MSRVLVVLPTESYRTADFVSAAEALGVELAIASEEEQPLRADDRFVAIDCSDPDRSADALAELAATTPVDAIVAADDAGVEIAARAAARIGLPHNPPESAAATLDKLDLRRRLAAAEIPQARFAPIRAGDDPAKVAADVVGYPAVLKPRNLQASRGVLRVDSPDQARAAAERIRGIVGDPEAVLVAEEFLPGPEVAVEGLVWDGELEILAIFDKPDPLDGPTFEETIYVTPTRLPSDTVDEVESLVDRGVAALGLTNGPVHAEIRLGGGHPRLVEVAARSIGGLCGRSLRFGLMDTSLEVVILRQALGMRKPSLRRQPGAAGVMMLPIPGSGRLEGVSGRDEATSVPGITGLEITIPIGGQVVPLPEGDRYLGFLFARGDTPSEVEEALRTAHRALHFDIRPS